MKGANILLAMLVACLTSSCTTRLTVKKPYAEVRAAMDTMATNLNQGFQTTNVPIGPVMIGPNASPIRIEPDGALVLRPSTNDSAVLRAGTNRPVVAYIAPGDMLRYKEGSGTNRFGEFLVKSPGTNAAIVDWKPQVWLPARTREDLQAGVYYLYIGEKIELMNSLPIGNIATWILAKPSGENRTKVRFVTKRYGFSIDSRIPGIEKQRRRELADILEGRGAPGGPQ